MKTKTLEEIKKVIHDCKFEGLSENITFIDFSTIEDANETSVIWIKPTRKDKSEIVKNTKAKIIVLDSLENIPESKLAEKVFIISDNPKLTFLRLAKTFSSIDVTWGIHPTAFVHNESKIHGESYIGPFTHIGKSTIGKGTIIHGHCFIYDQVTILENVEIHAGTIIGADGFGYAKNSNGEYEKFPHIGGVLIENNVDIGANTCIDRGSLGNTILKEGCKIDNLVHIAHNVVVGKNAMVIANSMIGGSTIIGDDAWISPSVSLMNGIVINKGAVAGLGAVVTKDIPENETWAGIPAKELKDFVAQQKAIKKITESLK